MIALVTAVALAMGQAPGAAVVRDSATLLIRLGKDTTTIVRYKVEPGRLNVDEVTLVPRVLRRYVDAELNADGTIARLEGRTVDPQPAPGAPGLVDYTEIVTRGDETIMRFGQPVRDS